MRAILFATALAMISLLPAVAAADDASESSIPASVIPTQGVDLRTLIASVSERTHKKFLVDPRVAGTVHLDGVAPREVTYPMLLTILAVHVFAVYEQEGVIVVTPDANQRFFPSSVVKPDEIRTPDAEVVTTIVVVKNAKATELVTILRPLVAPTGQLNAVADRNAIVIVDRAANVRRLVAIIRELEKVPAIKPD